MELAFLAALFLVSVLVRGASLSTLVAAPDELTYASRAFLILGAHWGWPSFTMWDQPPLFEYLLALVTIIGGASLDTLRWVSVIMGSLAIVAGYYLAKSLYGKTAGVVSAVVIAVDPFQILYSRQAYIESTVITLILFALLFFWSGVIKNRNMKVAALGGVLFGLALDSKYITLVMTVAMFVFLLLYRKKIPGGFPRRELLVYFGIGFLCFVPVLADLYVNNANPFYFDLVGRFQLHHSSPVVNGLSAGGGIIYIGFRNFVQTFFRFSSGNILATYPPSLIDIPIWIAISIFVFAFFVGSFFLRRNPREGFLLILFVAFLGFAFSYPGKRTYFTLYPELIFIVMLGGLAQLCANRVKVNSRPNLRTILAACFIALTVSGCVINAFGLPASQKVGFGDWDDVTPILAYINANHGANASVAVSLSLIAYYIVKDNLSVSIEWMLQQQYYYSESAANQSLQSPIEGNYPLYTVISLSVVERTNPQFVIIPAVYYTVTPGPFQEYMTAHYYQPLDTKHVFLFQIRPAA
ncbi:MAG TPA: glycosyltransferase family 39 protein [Nitrososphaerales archaeon]|nr:glycosyltransferase family 39 protein [Nitrososphaerales archaeon]